MAYWEIGERRQHEAGRSGSLSTAWKMKQKNEELPPLRRLVQTGGLYKKTSIMYICLTHGIVGHHGRGINAGGVQLTLVPSETGAVVQRLDLGACFMQAVQRLEVEVEWRGLQRGLGLRIPVGTLSKQQEPLQGGEGGSGMDYIVAVGSCID